MKRKEKKAFTILEILVVVIIIGVLAGIAIPRFQRTIEQSHETDAINQLTTIHAAIQIYNIRTGRYWPLDGGSYDLTAINNALSLNVIANGMTYSCTGSVAGTTFTCTAIRQAPADSFTVTVTQADISPTNPQCTAGACP